MRGKIKRKGSEGRRGRVVVKDATVDVGGWKKSRERDRGTFGVGGGGVENTGPELENAGEGRKNARRGCIKG